MKKNRQSKDTPKAIEWLPVDSRIFSPLFSFRRIHGISKIFLILELVSASMVVAGTLVLVVYTLIARQTGQ